MAIGVSSISGVDNPFALTQEAISSTLNNIVNVSDDENIGIGGLLLNSVTAETITKKQTLTTNPVESGVKVSDHIIKDPILLSVVAQVGDTDIDIDKGLNAINKRLLSALPNVTAFLPKRTATQLTKVSGLITQANDQINKIQSVLEKAGNIFDLFSKSVQEEPLQKQVSLYFDYLFTSSQPIQIQTKHKIYNNMVLISLPEERSDQFLTNFNLVFQQVTFAETQVLEVAKFFKKPSGQAAPQTSQKENGGKQQGEDVPKSLATTIIGLFK